MHSLHIAHKQPSAWNGYNKFPQKIPAGISCAKMENGLGSGSRKDTFRREPKLVEWSISKLEQKTVAHKWENRVHIHVGIVASAVKHSSCLFLLFARCR